MMADIVTVRALAELAIELGLERLEAGGVVVVTRPRAAAPPAPSPKKDEPKARKPIEERIQEDSAFEAHELGLPLVGGR